MSFQTTSTPTVKAKKKSPAKTKSKTADIQEESGQGKIPTSEKSPGDLVGFRPPPGIVHEALMAGKR